MLRLATLSQAELILRLSRDGLRLRTGPLVFCIRSKVADVARGLAALYGDHPIVGPEEFADFHISVDRVGLRRWLRPQLAFLVDGENSFAPLPGGQGLPMLEWGMNWCVSGACHQYLILHAAVLERNGRALVMPAPSGSGKSTLCAALLFRGWRLLSDELALIDIKAGQLVPLPRAVSLKNASIDVKRQFAGPALQFASIVHDTSKGVVGHFKPPLEAVQRGGDYAQPGWVIFPRYVAEAPAVLTPLSPGQCLMRLIENAFNYNVHQRAGFEALADLVAGSSCHEFSYSSLDEAVALFEQLATADLAERRSA
ncbi:HprK-related kinase A [Roseateles sp. GG27B]